MSTSIDLLGAVIGVVGYARTLAPKIDGWRVLLLTLCVGIICAFAFAPDTDVTLLACFLILKTGLKTALLASGGMQFVNYGATKLGDALGKAQADAQAKMLASAGTIMSTDGPPGPGTQIDPTIAPPVVDAAQAGAIK